MGATPSLAQVVAADSTVNTIVNGGGPFSITGGTQQLTTLFHSFSEFSPGTENVSFDLNMGQSTVDAIVGRVTGINASFIDGEISLTGGNNPDLFLINPNGIAFGGNASLSLPGSFIASTADSVVFENGFEFSAIVPSTAPLLTVSVPIGLQLGSYPGDITGNGPFLEVQSGQTFGLVGGSISFDDVLVEASEGRVELFAATDALVPLTTVNGQQAFGTQPSVGEWRDIIFQNYSEIFNEGNGGGAVQLQGKRVSLQGRSRISVINEGSTAAGDINIYGSEQIDVTGETSSGSPSRIISEVDENASIGGNGGDINIFTDQFLILDGGVVRTEAESVENGGDINIRANHVELSGSGIDDGFSFLGSKVDDKANATGQGGDINIVTNQFRILDGGEIRAETESAGNSGSINITADYVELSGVGADGGRSLLSSKVDDKVGATGRGGNVFIKTQTFLADDGALLGAESEGVGDAGDLILTVTGDAIFQGNTSGGSGSFVNLESEVSGAGGNLTLRANRLFLRDGALFDADTEGTGKGGSIDLQAKLISLSGINGNGFSSTLTTEVDSSATATAQGGDILIQAERLELSDGALIESITDAAGSAGNVVINAQIIDLNGAVESRDITSINAGVFGNVAGTGGTIILNTDILNLQDGATLNTSTEGSGDGGSIEVNARAITISGQSPSGVRSGFRAEVAVGGSGQGGQIKIDTEDLTIQGGEITTSTAGKNDAGQIVIVSAGDINADASDIRSEVLLGAIGNGGGINIKAQNLNFSNQSRVTVATNAQGNAGEIAVMAANDLNFTGNSQLISSVGDNAQGNAGRIDVSAGGEITLNNSSFRSDVGIDAIGNGGSITVVGNNIDFSNNAQLTTTTRGIGDAGRIEIKALDIVHLSSQSRVSSSAEATAIGNGGDIFFSARRFDLRDASIRANNLSDGGQGGNVELVSRDRVILERSDITAITNSGDGGNLNLDVGEVLFLRDHSLLSTTAGQAGGGGNGGNINLTAPLILSFPSENSDIVANAFTGNGGNIILTTKSLLGLAFRPQLTPESDITASSQFGVSGAVTINDFLADLESGLITTAASLTDPSDEIVQGCSSNRRNAFIATGRGGIPLSPNQTVSRDRLWMDTRNITSDIVASPIFSSPSLVTRPALTEANAWHTTSTGQVELIAVNASSPTIGGGASCSG
ncbi:filamentous hemagglutinin N-terminal domain-containing protein [[Leptolyngbya] sp. PCC 7376]|uniref:two-partner secretion domain-containing protein n=1 Tax=[Leptolyngbya] sp. PCC 7376 TaxID=111781 RepID=UPI0003123C7E|nr:filamentous hemagglutinin N-terminal domain-containing protein [[Leptolyngbya] sp. PCC 7376]